MKILSLNTWAGVVLEPLLDFFEKNKDIDIFCLQEIYKEATGKTTGHDTLDMKLDLFERIESRLKETHDGYFRPSHKDYYGQAIFIKKNLIVDEEGDVFIFDNPVSEKRGNHSRNLQYICIKFNNKPLIIGNVHGLWNGMGKTDTEDRLEQSHRIRSFMDGRSESKVIIGDFNLSPDTESLAIVHEGMQNLIQDFGITSTRTSLYEKENRYADYAFVSPEINVTNFEVLPDEVSDHAALLLEIN